jgi:predicted Zn-dependent protease
LTVTHELGHAMGLFKHSPNPNDLMAPDPVSGPSTRDRNTVQQLYHFEADLTASR